MESLGLFAKGMEQGIQVTIRFLSTGDPLFIGKLNNKKLLLLLLLHHLLIPRIRQQYGHRFYFKGHARFYGTHNKSQELLSIILFGED